MNSFQETVSLGTDEICQAMRIPRKYLLGKDRVQESAGYIKYDLSNELVIKGWYDSFNEAHFDLSQKLYLEAWNKNLISMKEYLEGTFGAVRGSALYILEVVYGHNF